MSYGFEDSPLPDRRPRRRRRAKRQPFPKWALVLIIAAVPLGLILFCAGAGFLYFWSAKELPATAADRAAVVTAKDLVDQLTDFEHDPEKDVFTKKRYLDGSYELEYEYETDEIYVSCLISVEQNDDEAKGAMQGAWVGTKIGAAWEGDVKIDERNDQFRWGDESRYGLITVDGEPTGHLFVARKGKRVFTLILGGIYFNEPESFRLVVADKLAKLDAYHPGD